MAVAAILKHIRQFHESRAEFMFLAHIGTETHSPDLQV